MNKDKTLPKAWEEIDKHSNYFLPKDGGIILGELSVLGGIVGELTGNSSTATKLKNPVIIRIGDTEKVLDGLNNISWSIDEIGILKSCPYNIGDIFLTTNTTNPSTVWLGTTWSKIEGRMLLGTSGSGASKATGGSNTATLSTANLPPHTHSASQSAHAHTQPAHTHKTNVTSRDTGGGYASNAYFFHMYNQSGIFGSAANSPNVASAGGDTTGSATPSISIGATGSGSAFSILSAYYTVHMWLRTA